MSVIFLDDECEPEFVKRQRVGGGKAVAAGAPPVVKQTTKTSSVASMASSADSFMSRASARSAASSNCSFARLAPSEEDESSVVRIAIGGL
jgi:hypothetical protein